MAEKPTYSEMTRECAVVEQFVSDEVTMTECIDRGLAHVKRHLLNSRGIKWSHVYDSSTSDYFLDSDGIANNKDNLHKAIRVMTIALIYRDNAQDTTDSAWWGLYQAYRGEAEALLDTAKLDIDEDEDGGIDADEESLTGQVFVSL